MMAGAPPANAFQGMREDRFAETERVAMQTKMVANDGEIRQSADPLIRVRLASAGEGRVEKNKMSLRHSRAEGIPAG